MTRAPAKAAAAPAAPPKSYKIVGLQAENIKKITAVEIKPDGNLVAIAGRNGAGKTSILDSILWAIDGASHIQAQPIRKGADRALIRLDLGDVVVTRKFRKREDDSVDTSVVVESAEGARFPSPQRLLDSFLGALSFDPLAFARMAPKDQFAVVRRFVPDVDFDAIDKANEDDFKKRTDVNRRAREAAAAATSILVPDGTPEEPVDEAALVAELEAAGQTNTDIATRRENRIRVAGQADGLDQTAILADAQAAEKRRVAQRLIAEAAALEADAIGHRANAAALRKKIADAGDLPEPVDTTAVRARIEAARGVNAAVAARARRAEHEARAATLTAESAALTAAIEKRKADAALAVEAAKMPVPALTLVEGAVYLNGFPFDQASDAEQLRASVLLAMAGEPRLRVIRVRDGSLLDEDGMRLLSDIADERDMQVWVERVDSSGKVGFVIEDGHLAGAPPVEGEQGEAA